MIILAEGIGLFSMIFKGGWLMLPIFALSVWAVFIFCDQYIKIKKFNRSNLTISEELEEVSKQIITGEATNSTPVNNIIKRGLSFKELPAQELRTIIESAANEETVKMERSLPKINLCGTLAPMIGFLGTVVGMIQAFYDMAQAGNNVNIEVLSRGIYTAMVTTVAGLIVGIIASLLANLLATAIDNVVGRMEQICNAFIENQYKR
ncbi:MAG: MotA/TolQ/ExbB proton channel family protein [Marinifilaceae bacterium]|nr:MotA/TolQ/ExbB proton channel family protein [Marinifilaceae bacterium]